MNIQPRITIRVSKGSLAFAMADSRTEAKVAFEPYTAKSGVSMAANLRDAFKTANLLQVPTHRALVLIDAPTLLIPIEEFQEANAETLYTHCYPTTEGAVIMSNVLPEMNAVALFAVNKDLKMVVEDHFPDVRIQNVIQPVWSHLYRRGGVSGQRRRLYGYFHDRCIDIFSFQQRRFRFANRFDATHLHDALYFLLFAWNQLAFDNENDEMHILGNIENKEWIVNKLKGYLRRVYVLSPSAELNRLPVTQIEGVDFDMML